MMRSVLRLLLLLLLDVGVTTTKASLVCLRGTYLHADSRRCVPCPGGTFGDRAGLTTPQCSGLCSGGHFCPPGSISSREKLCGSTTFYCPSGSAMRQRVDPGFYTVTYPFPETGASITQAENQIQCEPGYYCVNGIRRKCPAATYGISVALQSPTCSGLCPKGFYCPEGTSDPVPCPAGTFGDQLGLMTAECSGLCPIGHYCIQGTVTPRKCPAGSFGGTQGLTTKRCSSRCYETPTCDPSPCPAGFYCPLATVTPTPCGDASVFCPTGSSLPTTVSLGYYSIRETASGADTYIDGTALASVNQTTRSDQRVCERGTFCVGGVKRWCPPGTYGNSEGLSTAQCSGPCPSGFFCPLGTASYARHPCTERTSFCRQGSASHSVVSTGYYTITAAPTGDVRVDQQICPLGSYCPGGVKYLCPTGTYGATTGLATAACSGRCQDGFVCPPGSVSATQTPCPAGQYSRNGVACAPCLPGYWCAVSSPDPMQHPCGSDAAYCPLGSSSPTQVAAGYYAVGQSPNSHTSQALCSVQTVRHLQQCPSRTIGANNGL